MGWLEPFGGDAARHAALPRVTPFPALPYCSLPTPFGLIAPNAFDWRPGDVVYFRAPLSPGDLPIVGYQAFVFGRGDACLCTHVGIYDGNGQVWDAMPGDNVRSRPVTQVLQERRKLRIRRFAGTAIGWSELASYLSSQLGTRYTIAAPGVRKLLARRLWRWRLPAPAVISDNDVFCSLLVVRALQFSTPAFPGLGIVPLPGDFVASSHFRDVETYWCRQL